MDDMGEVSFGGVIRDIIVGSFLIWLGIFAGLNDEWDWLRWVAWAAFAIFYGRRFYGANHIYLYGKEGNQYVNPVGPALRLLFTVLVTLGTWFFLDTLMFVPALVVSFLIWLSCTHPLRDWTYFYKERWGRSDSVVRLIESFDEFGDDPILREPLPPEDTSKYEAAIDLLPMGTTFGIPGYGVENVKEFGGRALAGAKGERILGGMLQQSGIPDIPGVFTFWSMQPPMEKYKVDIDCVILYGNKMWLVNAKYYTPGTDADYLFNASERDELVIKSAPIPQEDWDKTRELRDAARRDSDVYAALGVIRDRKGKVYRASHADEMSQKGMKLHESHSADVQSMLAVVPTSNGSPGILKGTVTYGQIPIDHAANVIEKIRAEILSHPLAYERFNDDMWNHFSVNVDILRNFCADIHEVDMLKMRKAREAAGLPMTDEDERADMAKTLTSYWESPALEDVKRRVNESMAEARAKYPLDENGIRTDIVIPE